MFLHIIMLPALKLDLLHELEGIHKVHKASIISVKLRQRSDPLFMVFGEITCIIEIHHLPFKALNGCP